MMLKPDINLAQMFSDASSSEKNRRIGLLFYPLDRITIQTGVNTKAKEHGREKKNKYKKQQTNENIQLIISLI